MSQRQQRLHSGLDRPREPETVLPVKTVCPGTARDGAAAGRRVRLGTARQVTRERPSVASLTPRGRQAPAPPFVRPRRSVRVPGARALSSRAEGPAREAGRRPWGQRDRRRSCRSGRLAPHTAPLGLGAGSHPGVERRRQQCVLSLSSSQPPVPPPEMPLSVARFVF